MTVTFIDIVEMGAILSPGPLPWEEGVDLPRSTLLRETNINFQLPTSKCGGLIFLNVLHIRNKHTNF